MPRQRTREPESAVDPTQLEEPGGSVKPLGLDRLLSVSVLTPGQALFVAVQLLDAADARDATDGAHPAGTRLGAVTLTPSGEVDVGPSHADEGTSVTELLSRLLQNARRLPAHPRPEQLSLLHRLEEAAGDPTLEPDARARELEGALADTLGSGYRQRLSGQLAALVDAFAHVAPSIPAADDTVPSRMRTWTPVTSHRAALAAQGAPRPASRRTAPTPAAPARPPHRGRPLVRRRNRGRRVALVVLVLLAVLAGGGYLLVRGPGIGVLASLAHGNNPAAPSTSAPAQPSNQPGKHQQTHRHRSRALPTLAVRHAGLVTAVTVQKTGRCKPGSRCPVKVTVHLRRSATSRVVGWKMAAARLCKRGTTWSPVTTMTARPGWTTVFAHSSVRVPKGRSLALIALTTTPARAQSRPVPVTGTSLLC